MTMELLNALKYWKWKTPAPTLRFFEPLSNHTTYRIGGKAACLAIISHRESLWEFLEALNGEKPMIIGKGSNLLWSDEDFPQPVVKLRGEFERIRIEDNCIEAGGGVSISQLLRRAANARIGGLEFLTGVPGTVGGAVMNNSGSRLNGILQQVETVWALDLEQKKILSFSPNDFSWGYRYSSLRNQQLLITAVRIKGEFRPQEEIEAEMERIMSYRKTTQPVGAACAGSVFKNPPGFFAGKLIEECGLKGVCMGKAQVSEKHANFIINRGGASFQQVRKMIQYVQETVYRFHKVFLETEIQEIPSPTV